MKNPALLLLLSMAVLAGSLQAQDVRPISKVQPRCEPLTGSRIPPTASANGSCPQAAPFLHSYSREDVERTGRTDLSAALTALDSSLTLTGGAMPGSR